jgi:hypothetical protein
MTENSIAMRVEDEIKTKLTERSHRNNRESILFPSFRFKNKKGLETSSPFLFPLAVTK